MFRRASQSKRIAGFFLGLLTIQTFYPAISYALTSGPAQPEYRSFSPAGTSDMVDLFTGDFNYNLPLMDVDGYPVNMAYNAGANIDDEATWVGLGWNLNVGSVSRQLRGIPDDFQGDRIKTEHYAKPKVTVGGKATAKFELFGYAGFTGYTTVSLNVFSDNYTGIGAELGVNPGISYSNGESGTLTGNMGIGVSSSTSSGVDITPTVSLSTLTFLSQSMTIAPGLSASLGYNTRGGLKDLTLATSFSNSRLIDGLNRNAGSRITYNTDPVIPKVQIPFKSTYGSFAFDAGISGAGAFTGVGGMGYRSVREVKNRIMQNPAFGFLYADAGKDNKDALMDFIREKENPVIPKIPHLAIPVHTPDLFNYSGQAGSGQFRLQRGGTGILFDNTAVDESTTQSIGFDAGFGLYGHGGVNYYQQSVSNSTSKWTVENQYLKKGDFQQWSKENPKAEHVFFKKTGEMTTAVMENETVNRAPDAFLNDNAIAVATNGKIARDYIRSGTATSPASNLIQQNKQARATSIQYLTAAEAVRETRKTGIPVFAPNTYGQFNPAACHSPQSTLALARVGDHRAAHHISEISVTDPTGKKSVYGIPVYNIKQSEYSFALGNDYSKTNVATKNLVDVPLNGSKINHIKGIDHYYHQEDMPAYPASYLLTEVQSADYVDLTGNGISDDDLGTTVKFNYSKTSNYHWRSPIDASKATLNRGLLADPDDDKGSFVYGEKEMYYLHSIESKNKIAYFIVDNRYDALGVVDWKGTINPASPQKVLKEIRLYSKADLNKPIKTVKFEYGYDLCQQVPNFDPSQAANFPNKGKLTLKKVYFLYGDSPKGVEHPYEFFYNNEETSSSFVYGYQQSDRWGSYKPSTANAARNFSLTNEEFPYAHQDPATANLWAGVWKLNKIKLPSGGEINITYEADDYAWVQDERAMEMIKIYQLLDQNNQVTTNLRNVKSLSLDISFPANVTTANEQTKWFKKYCLSNSDYLYTKLFVNVSDNINSTDDQYYEFIPCHAKVVSAVKDGTRARVTLEDINNSVTANPIIHAAWQRMRLEYPRYAYPGYKNRIKDDNFKKALEAAISAIINSAKNLDELRRSFNERARDKNFATKYKLDKSFVRITKQDGKKIGGGSRVKKITITDNWSTMSGNTNSRTAIYGQEYDYTTTEKEVTGSARSISSGVACYEPAIGSDENPLRQPIPYVQQIKGGLNNFYNLERPLGESFYPAAQVGYSKVTVRNLGVDGNPDAQNKTGHIVNEFCTARDYPVVVESVKNEGKESGPAGWYSLFGSYSVHELTYSQGLAVKLNDMHGKPRSVRVFNKAGIEVSSTVYEYQDEATDAGKKTLTNKVTIVDKDGRVYENKIIGRESEVFTDMRQQETINTGESINLGLDVIPFIWAPIPIPHWPTKSNDEYKLFRSAVTVKVIQYYGIVKKVIKTENGSSVSAENIAYDGETGAVVISSSTNEFNRPVYQVNLPAHWIDAQAGMGTAYKNEGTVIASFSCSNGEIPVSIINFMQEGDELLDLTATDAKYWVIKSAIGAGPMTKRVVDRNGVVQTLSARPVKVVKSGYRNLLQESSASIVCLNNPIVTDPSTQNKTIALSQSTELAQLKVLSASAAVYTDNWGMKQCFSCPTGYTLSTDGTTCTKQVNENNTLCFTWCRGGADAQYGVDGAFIKQNPTSTAWPVKSKFFGGKCTDCVAPSGFAASFAPVISSFDSSGNTSSFEKTGINNQVTPMLVSPTCTRTEYTSYPDNCDPTYCGRLYHAGVWLCAPVVASENTPLNEWIGFEKCFTVNTAKTYYLGYASDNYLRIYIDDVLITSYLTSSVSNFKRWTIDPITLTAGQHIIRVETLNLESHGSVAVEIYNNTYGELINPAFSTPVSSMIFSTARDVMGQDLQAFRTTTSRVWHYTEPGTGAKANMCNLTIQSTINPYVTGFAGNWRPQESKTYQVQRKYKDVFDNTTKGIDVKNAGYFDSFRSFWQVNTQAGNKWEKVSPTDSKWVTANSISLFNTSGQEIENKDALGRYSAALFSFREQLPAAVASNARNRELFYDSFEETFYRTGCGASGQSCSNTQFTSLNEGDGDISGGITPAYAHTGKYAIYLRSGITLKTRIHTNETGASPYLGTNNKGERCLLGTKDLYPSGFAPHSQKKYLVSLWSRQQGQTPQTTTLLVNGVSQINGTTGMRADGWMREEFIIDMATVNAPNNEITITLTGGFGAVIDDLRIQPFDALMKSYAYDYNSLRLMAELDENNYATFYEYDAEGSLIRVKKETEKGIITVKESRSSFQKNN